MVNNHRILDIRIRTCTGIKLKLAMLALRTKVPKKRIPDLKQKK